MKKKTSQTGTKWTFNIENLFRTNFIALDELVGNVQRTLFFQTPKSKVNRVLKI